MKLRSFASCVVFSLTLGSQVVGAQDGAFAIQRYDIQGNSLLAPELIERLVAPFTGPQRNYGDIQKALEVLEIAYRAQGYGAVNVHVPEQEITSGVIRLDVTEATLDKVIISGNQHFDAINVQTSLPAIKEGSSPNLRQISENVQLVNENPAKEVEVTLATSETQGRVDAKVTVKDENPQHLYLTLDNTGSKETGKHRIGFAYQHANLLGNDEVVTLAYTTSPDLWFGHPDDVKVDVYSVAFRKPFYGIGDSLDFIYGNSNVNAPAAQATGFGITGKGEVIGLRWNHLFPRQGEYSSRLVFGFDSKDMNSRCDNPVTGAQYPVAPPNPFVTAGTPASCVPYVVRPLSATYNAQLQGTDYQANYYLGLAYNFLPTGHRYLGTPGTATAGRHDRYSFITGRPVEDKFVALRYGGSYSRLLGNWQLRAALNGQLSDEALPSAEQFGLAGATTVRGFSERAISADTGHVVNLEAYTPNLAGLLGASGTLHGVFFYDVGQGRNSGAQGDPYDQVSIAAVGAGVRYTLQKDVNFSLDAAQVVDAGPVNTEERGNWRGHFRMTMRF